jgi:hypothetical protein
LSVAALLALVAILAVLAGCGGSAGGDTAGDGSGAPDNVASGSVRAGEVGGGAKGRRDASSAAAQRSSQGAARKDEAVSKTGGSRSEGASKHDAAPGDSTSKGTNGVAEVRSHSGHCPANITREQCKALAEQPISSAPSYTAKEPKDCLQAASRKVCEGMFEAEQAGHQNAGPSVAVERCLEERTRAQCEAQLAAQLEAQYAASKGE